MTQQPHSNAIAIVSNTIATIQNSIATAQQPHSIALAMISNTIATIQIPWRQPSNALVNTEQLHTIATTQHLRNHLEFHSNSLATDQKQPSNALVNTEQLHTITRPPQQPSGIPQQQPRNTLVNTWNTIATTDQCLSNHLEFHSNIAFVNTWNTIATTQQINLSLEFYS